MKKYELDTGRALSVSTGRSTCANYYKIAHLIGRVVPDYSSFNLYEQHSLKVKLKIEIAKQESEGYIPGPSFKVLSPYCRATDLSGAGATPSAGPGHMVTADEMEGDLALPSYQEHMQDKSLA